jgi:hypothetical protein
MGFGNVQMFDAGAGTPTLALLKSYPAILMYSDSPYADATALGNVVADYFDAGGIVVEAVFSNASLPIAGRWVSAGYQLINPTGQEEPLVSGAVLKNEPGSALLTGVNTLSAQQAYRSTGGAINGGIVVAQWNDGKPLIVRGVKNGRKYCSLNMFPPSSAARSDFWSGDGGAIMRNALQYQ